MNKIELPYFEDIDLNSLEEEYDVEVEYDYHQILIFLNEMTTADRTRIEFIADILKDLPGFDEENKIFIQNDFKDNGEAGFTYKYVTFHLDELGDAFKEHIDASRSKKENQEALLSLLYLKHISFYSDKIVFDYVLDDSISDELLVVVLDNEQNRSITWES